MKNTHGHYYLSPRSPDYQGKRLVKILELAAAYYSVTPADFKQLRKSMPLAAWRQMAMWACCKLSCETQDVIARAFGRRDHACVGYAWKTVEDYRSVDKRVLKDSEALLEFIRKDGKS